MKKMTRASLAVTALLLIAQSAWATPPVQKEQPTSIIAILIGLFTGR